MKRSILTVIISAIMLCMVNQVKAQQAKAYETISYIAKAEKVIYRLYYADGYIGASVIKFKHNKQLVKLIPTSGTTETNGELIFLEPNNSGKYEIVLKNINEEETAPENISGIYKIKGRTVKLSFSQQH